jgi:hypothetical protein
MSSSTGLPDSDHSVVPMAFMAAHPGELLKSCTLAHAVEIPQHLA